MKECPKCGTVYTDKTLSFCLSDGSELSGDIRDAETEVLPNFAADLDSEESISAQTVSSNTKTRESVVNKTGDYTRGGVSPFWILSTFGLLGIILAGAIIAYIFMSGNSGQANVATEKDLANESISANSERNIVSQTYQDHNSNTAKATTPNPVSSATPKQTPTPKTKSYRVTGVKSNDVLYIRPSPGNLKVVVGKIPPNGTGIRITGAGKRFGKSAWVPIVFKGKRGWVNRRYLAQAK